MNFLIIRLDDVSPLMDMSRFDLFVRLLSEYRIPAVLGVIPFHLKKERIDSIAGLLHGLEARGFEIAQHGYTHELLSENPGILNLKWKSEFAGLSYRTQVERISKGREILEKAGLSPVTFIPPWHTYDLNTLEALKENGFQIISDNYPSPGVSSKLLGGYIRMLQNKPKQIHGLTFIPQQHALPIRFLSLPHLVSRLRINYGVITICYHLTSLEFLGLSRIMKNRPQRVLTCRQLMEDTTFDCGQATE